MSLDHKEANQIRRELEERIDRLLWGYVRNHQGSLSREMRCREIREIAETPLDFYANQIASLSKSLDKALRQLANEKATTRELRKALRSAEQVTNS